MSRPHGIIVFGANGSGKTMLGQALARILDFKHIDHEAYAFRETGVPYTEARSRDECAALMLADMETSRGFVFSAVTGDFGDGFTPLYDLAVLLSVPKEVRLERIKRRGQERYGERIRKGGDMRAQHLKFIDFVATRSTAPIEAWAETLSCPVLRADGTEDYQKTAADIASRFYTKPGEPWRVAVAPAGTLEKYRFTVVFALSRRTAFEGGWLFCRHGRRDTWEPPGGHIEAGETPLDCAKRELYEETGATKFFIHPAFDYAVHRASEFSYGQVFYAEAETLGGLPAASEMVEVRQFRALPGELTYPQITPILFAEMKKWLGVDTDKAEYWDVLGADRAPTGRTHRRGVPMPDGDHHLAVRAWVVNGKGEFLITRRAFNKIGFPGMWEVPSGSAMAGEDSLTAVIREAREESGLVLLPEAAELFATYCRDNAFIDSWLFRQEFDLANVTLQEGETIDARAATWDEISKMMERGEYIGRGTFSEFDLLEAMMNL